MNRILTENQLPLQGLEQSEWTLPGELYFLREDYIRSHWSGAGLDPDHLSDAVRLGRHLSASPELKLLSWHLHQFYISDRSFFRYPDHISLLGPETGLFYVLLALSLAPLVSARAARERYPERYALGGLDRIGSTVVMREQNYPEEFGLLGCSLAFLQHYLHSPCYRIGRLDYILGTPSADQPELFLRGHDIAVLCKENWLIDEDGRRMTEGASSVWRTNIVWEGHEVIGNPIDPVSGRALRQEIRLDLGEWHRICPPGSCIANIHIPGGSGFTPDLLEDSFREASEFLSAYFSDRPVRSFFSQSWLFSPDWAQFLPKSHLAAVIRATSHFPGFRSRTSGLKFVFGRADGSLAQYPRDNSLRRTMLDLLEKRGYLLSGGLFCLPELLNR